MLKILKAYGIPDLIVETIGKMYEYTRAKVISPDGETDLFDILAEVFQGDTLAPYLFVIVLDYALRMAIDGKDKEIGSHLERRKSRRIGPVVVKDLDFADDIALLSMDIRQVQELLQSVEKCVGKVGLKMNAGKTKYMSYNQHESVTIKTNDGSILDEVGNFLVSGCIDA